MKRQHSLHFFSYFILASALAWPPRATLPTAPSS